MQEAHPIAQGRQTKLVAFKKYPEGQEETQVPSDGIANRALKGQTAKHVFP